MKEIEEALVNLDNVVKAMQLNRQQHHILSQNLKLLGDKAKRGVELEKEKK